MKKYLIKTFQGALEISSFEVSEANVGDPHSSSPVSEANVGDLRFEFLRFTATEDGIVVESIDGSTFHLAGGDVTSGLLTHGESIEVETYTIICEEIRHTGHGRHCERSEANSSDPFDGDRRSDETNFPDESPQNDVRDPSASPQDDDTSPQDDDTSPQDDDTSPQDDD